MSSSIPYDHPSLVLGNVADTKVLDLLKQIDSLQSKIDAAKDKLNSFVMMKRSLAMTINELTDMNVDVGSIKGKLSEIDSSITKSATDYMTKRIQCEEQIQQVREQISELETGDGMESPVDFSKSSIKKLPLSAESLKMDAQYFSFGSKREDDTIASIEKYVQESTSDLGGKSGDVAKAASSQVARQKQNHNYNLAGTLIITASCTHPNVAIIDPLIIDVDKAVSVWNSIYGSASDKIKTSDAVALKTLSESESPDEKNISLLSGVTYGSGFVGMVHIINTDTSSIGPSQVVIDRLQEKLRLGGWLENATGGIGVEPSIIDEVKKMLSTQSVSSHISVITMGAVPSISSNQLKLGVKSLIKPDTEEMNKYLLSQTTTVTDSVRADADKANTTNRMLAIKNTNAQSIIRGLGEIDHGSNNVLDINSMMNAFENYLVSIKGKTGSIGVPVNFYLKKITKSQIIKLWLEKYYPQKEKQSNSGDNKK